VPLLLSFQTCGSLAQGQWGRKDARGENDRDLLDQLTVRKMQTSESSLHAPSQPGLTSRDAA